MDITFFIIGLSLLSSNAHVSDEGIRILSALIGKKLNDNDILREENGRPFLIDEFGKKDKRCDFNISHSENMVAVSVVAGEDIQTGCDIQLVKAKTDTLKIANEFFSVFETDYISKDRTRFFEIWTLKESYLKLKGLTVFDMAKAPSFIGKNGSLKLQFKIDGNPVQFYLYELKDGDKQYFLSVAIEGDSLIPKIKWFSESLLPYKNLN